MTSLAAPEYPCLDDLMNEVLDHLLVTKNRFSASKGDGTEALGVSFRLTNARARLSRSEMRGKVFSGLGELFWYLSGSNRLDFIAHYIPAYRRCSDDGSTIHGAYGPRLFGESKQVQTVMNLLREKPSSRRAAIQIFSAADLSQDYKDIPCTCTLQAAVRDGMLNFFAYMRSNDAYWGLPHDVFAFTMLQEMIARALDVEVGFYQHMVGSLHLYDDKREEAQQYLDEKYQTIEPMPPMPKINPWPLVPALLAAEASIRTDPNATVATSFDPYWEDLLRLLRVYSEKHHKNVGYEERIATIRTQMSSSAYDVYFL